MKGFPVMVNIHKYDFKKENKMQSIYIIILVRKLKEKMFT